MTRWLMVALGLGCSPFWVSGCDAGMEPEGLGGAGGAGLELGACSEPLDSHGFVECNEGYRHRASQEACANEEREERIATGPCGIEGTCCEFDSDCRDEFACFEAGPSGAGATYGLCALRCETDQDCEGGHICECGAGAGRCVPSSCTTDEDCAGEALCVSSARDEGCGQHVEYSCQTPQDACATDHDCDTEAPEYETCATDGTRRVCQSQYQSCDS
ncbi:MAG TPA: hypothetical protein VN764_12690 [Polyangiaceae bacterium]|nr:hypothetical protein [Polyangiaceae bacterium]